MGIRKVDVRSRAKPKKPPADHAELVAREHHRIERLERELARVKRRLARAKMRYSILLRLAADQSRRELLAGSTLSKEEKRQLRAAKEPF